MESEEHALELMSEKMMYSSALEEISYKYDVEGFIWGEEMYDCKIHIYPYKLSSIPEYTEVYDDLINVGLVYLNNKEENPVHVYIIRLNEKTGIDIYMPEGNFNSYWKYVRNSVAVGMQICNEKGIEIDIEKPEDILDISMLERNGKCPFVDEETYEVKYLRRELSDDEIQEQKRKQRALDNPNNRYFYDEDQQFYHDRTCDEIKTIIPKHFMASESIPPGFLPCKKCHRMMLLRKACDPYVKQIPDVDVILRRAGISNTILEKYVIEKSLWFHVNNDGNLMVRGAEDTRIIKELKGEKYSLWHNNYVKTAPRERYIASGFHDQKIIRKKLQDLLGYIDGYTFEGHLAAEDRKIAVAEMLEKARIKEEKRKRKDMRKFLKRL